MILKYNRTFCIFSIPYGQMWGNTWNECGTFSLENYTYYKSFFPCSVHGKKTCNMCTLLNKLVKQNKIFGTQNPTAYCYPGPSYSTDVLTHVRSCLHLFIHVFLVDMLKLLLCLKTACSKMLIKNSALSFILHKLVGQTNAGMLKVFRNNDAASFGFYLHV